MANYYNILGLRDFASLQEIKTAYRKLSKKFHPDVNDGDKFFEERFKEIQNAYEHLTNPALKQKHDDLLKQFHGSTYKDYSNSYNQKQDTGKTEKKEEPQKRPSEKPKAKSKSKKFLFNKWYLLLLVPVFVILYLSIKKNNTPQYNLTISKDAVSKLILEGQAVNLTLNKKSGFSLELTEYPFNIFKCQGKFDGGELSGRFEVKGGDINEVSDPNTLDLSLKGDIIFEGNSKSGFSPGTKANIKLNLLIQSDIVKGSYVIDSITNTMFMNKQLSGKLELNIKKKVRNP